MSKTKINITTRTSIWQAYKKKCFYCQEKLSYHDLQIDHIIPESTPLDEINKIIKKLGLKKNFKINDFINLVPTHDYCNRRKSNRQYSESALRFYLEETKATVPIILKEIAKLKQHSSNESLLTKMASRIENGYLSIKEVVSFIQNVTQKYPIISLEPIVISFGANVLDYIDSQDLPAELSSNYIKVCDWLEDKLLKIMRKSITSLSAQTEASYRNGETLSLRIAFWNINLEQLDNISMAPWEILEISYYSDIYDEKWDTIFPKAVVETYHSVIYNGSSGIARCPECGSNDIKQRSMIDNEHDESYDITICEQCGWTSG